MKDDALQKELQNRYELIVCALIANHGKAYLDELLKLTNLTASQIAKALQYGRRNFDFENRPINCYVMSSNDGYFLTDSVDLAIAYTVQTMKDAISRLRTARFIYEEMKAKHPDKLDQAMSQRFEDESDEMEPWAVFNNLIEDFTKWR